MRMPDVVLGIDSSTQSTKVEARNVESGEVLATGSAPHPPTTPPVSEQDPTAWWLALTIACEQIPENVRNSVVGVSVAGQQHGLVLLGANGEAVRPAKLWNDTTSADDATRLVENLGAEHWADTVGSLPVAAFTVAKLAWVVAHEPAVLATATQVMLPHDYLTYRLTGNHVTDRGDASGTGWFDPKTDTYQPDVLTAAGVASNEWIGRLPRVLGPSELAGQLTHDAAQALGLSPDVVVGPGSGDNMGSALGLGLDTGDLVISLGTSGVAYSRSATPTSDPSGAVAGFADAAGGFLPLVCTLNATKVTDAVARWLGTDAKGLAEMALTAGESDVTVVPWFDGERTPNRPHASGSFFGLRTDTTPADIAQAAHDGVLCSLFNGVDALAECGVDISGTLHLIGGGARSVAYRQRCADLWGRPIALPHSDETVATGAAAQIAAITTGDGIEAIQESWRLGESDIVQPDATVDAAAIRARYAEAIA